jgi:hypothetical protein
MKNGLASETLGNWGNHLLLKTRREASSGQAEQHEKQADLIVVQSGQATIVIGGRILNGKTTAPNEVRGMSIEGGENGATGLMSRTPDVAAAAIQAASAPSTITKVAARLAVIMFICKNCGM